jgi:hypothetical protein
MGALSGKLLSVTVGGKKIRCQTDATLNLTTNLTEDDPCKPDDDTPLEEAGWTTRTVDSRDWNVTVSAKNFLDATSASNVDQRDLIDEFISGNLNAEIEFLSTPGQHPGDTEDVVYSGNAILATIAVNAPASGNSTSDYTFSGNGPLSSVRIPISS